MEATVTHILKKHKYNGISTTSSSLSFFLIPHEVVVDHIFTRLPTKSLIRCSCVCKLWKASILDDPLFASAHFHQYSLQNERLLFKFLYDPHQYQEYSPDYLGRHIKNRFYYLENNNDHQYAAGCCDHDYHDQLRGIVTIRSAYVRKLVGFCNGLVCLFNEDTQIFEVCNPTRRQILAIFSPQHIPVYKSTHYCYGFGFDPLTKEYKVVFVFDVIEGPRCMVFTLGINSSTWREIKSPIPHPFLRSLKLTYDIEFGSKFPVSCNGALYWSTRRCVVSFDLHDEKFQVLQLPSNCVRPVTRLVLRGSLCFARLRKNGERRGKVLLCILKNNHKDIDHDNDQQAADVWVNETFPVYCSAEPWNSGIAVFQDQVLLFWLNFNGRTFSLYNVHTKKQKKLRYRDGWDNCYLMSHMENFLSLQTLVPDGIPKILGGSYPNLESIDLESITREPAGVATVAFLFLGSQNQGPIRTEFYL